MALPQLSSIIYDSYQPKAYRYGRNYLPQTASYTPKASFMVVPMQSDNVEIPIFLIPCLFYKTASIFQKDALCVKLTTEGYFANYASIDSKVRLALSQYYTRNKLVRITTKNHVVYYATDGAIFDDNLQPMMMMTWQFHKTQVEDVTKLEFVKPILRIAPEVFLNKADELQKYIINKILPLAIAEDNMRIPTVEEISPFYNKESSLYKVKVEIDSCPFHIKTTDKPSISTTNKELLNTALNHLDEIIQ